MVRQLRGITSEAIYLSAGLVRVHEVSRMRLDPSSSSSFLRLRITLVALCDEHDHASPGPSPTKTVVAAALKLPRADFMAFFIMQGAVAKHQRAELSSGDAEAEEVMRVMGNEQLFSSLLTGAPPLLAALVRGASLGRSYPEEYVRRAGPLTQRRDGPL